MTFEQDVQISSGDLGANGKLDIQKEVTINGNLFADKIAIDKDSQVNGNASYNRLDIKKESKILGTQTEPVQLPIAPLPEIPSFAVGTQDFKFAGQNNALATGSYRDVTVEKDGRLILNGSTYNFRKLELKENSILIFSSPTILNVKEELRAQQNVSIVPAANNLQPTDLEVRYVGTKPIEFGKRVFLNFKLMAPEASVQIGEETTLRGQILARKIRIKKDSVVSRELSGVKIAKQEEIITDPGGGVYPINILLVSLTPDATLEDALKVAQSINGRIVGNVSSINLYQIEVQTRTIEELEDIINTVRSRTDLKLDGVFRDYLLPIDV